ncbi:muscle M-line assembly protein unc-89-like isoform X1 [Athalia rosae]|uniref:muscle M-line assembly protein unc-89-like isoform X1 n=1 Tax=Athalia rosae TaxID=37344 RepID=UPI0020347B73|nr:muscle M-line assembly protein unc-89-like isoform X1 [Athalia rosae]
MSIESQMFGARGVSMDMENSWAAQGLASAITNLNNMARFQQKQMQEKEQKLLQLYDQQQQRAYQVVQRGSAGSNGSSSVSQQHSVTRTTTTTHTSSTTQGGKVRQMFDERRQTTVKGIDRSYPLEPLDNKSNKKQIDISNNGHVPSKNHQNGTVTRQTVTVRRTARADVNSNVNNGKPIISYHEEVSREGFDNVDNFGNENRNGKYIGGNNHGQSQNGVRIEEILDEDTIERNRMLAKIHLMEYDKNLRHRVNNDLNNEQFPDDLMIDVPDKLLPRKPAASTRKLSQAEARLERFKNSNAKRNNAVINTTTNRSKRSEPMFPASKLANSRAPALSKSKTTEVSKTVRSKPELLVKSVRAKTPERIALKPSSKSEICPEYSTVEPDLPVRPPSSALPSDEKVQSAVKETEKSQTSTKFIVRNFPRVQKSPSPETTGRRSANSIVKTKERKSSPPSPSKSPDTQSRQSTGARSPVSRPTRRSSDLVGVEKSQERVSAESDSKSQSDDVIKSAIPSPTIPEKHAKPSATVNVDAAPKTHRESTRKFSAERSSSTQNQRQASPTATVNLSTRPSSSLSTASSTTSSARGTPSADNQAQRMATKVKNPNRSSGATSPSAKKGPMSARNGPSTVSSDALVPCKVCGRRFADDRISLHERICSKTGQKKRKQFDTVLHRVQGTELEAFAKKNATPAGRQGERRVKEKKPEVKPKSNWRRKHEDFINAIRSAKQVQAHLAAGGKLSDLPPPPMSDTSDYIQCPHCGRKFNQGAAERHIPKCQNMMHNKPNPRAPPKPKR